MIPAEIILNALAAGVGITIGWWGLHALQRAMDKRKAHEDD